MAGEEYESPVTGLKYTVPKYEEPADAPLAFKDFADSITVGGPASRENAVLQALEGDSGLAWAEGMALSVVDAVPDDADGEIGDVVFIPGGPGGAPAAGGGKVLQVVRATDSTDRSTNSTSFVDITGMSVTITPTKATSAIIILHTSDARTSSSSTNVGYFQITDSANNPISGAENCRIGCDTFGVLLYPMTMVGYAMPATTLAVTYKARFRSHTSTGSLEVKNGSQQTGQMFALEIGA